MSPRQRTAVFLLAMAALAALYGAGLHGLAGFGRFAGRSVEDFDRLSVTARHTTDVVTAINFDIRGFDTLGEEFILFTAASAVSLILRSLRDEEEGTTPADTAAERSERVRDDTVRVAALMALAPGVAVGLNIASHGQITPGGGFQGGVIIASALLVIYLGGQYFTFDRLSPVTLLDAVEAVGALGYAIVGLSALVTGAAFLANVIPLGSTGDIDSAGTIAVISFAVGIEVTASMVLVVSELVEQTLLVGRS